MTVTTPSRKPAIRFSLARLMLAIAAFGFAAGAAWVWEMQVEFRVALAILAVVTGGMVLLNRVKTRAILAAILLALFGAVASIMWRGQRVQAQADDEIYAAGAHKIGFKYETLLEWFGPPTSIDFVGFTDKGSDQSLAVLGATPEIRLLVIRGPQYTNAALVHLEHAVGLRSLTLEDTSVTDDGLRQLASLTSLRELHVSSTKISGAGLHHLAGFGSLEELDVSYTKIGDADVPELAELKTLNHLSVHGTEITPAGLRALRKALPQCDVRD